MKETPKISAMQLMLLLLLARVMHTMIYRFEDFTSGTPIMLGLLITTAIEGIAALPAVIYYDSGGKSAAAEISGKKKPVLYLYSFYFTVIAGSTAALFAEFLDREFSETVPPAVAIILIAAVGGYCAYMGIEGLARAGTAVFWLFAALFFVMCAVNEGEFNWLNIRPFMPGDAEKMGNYIVEGLSSSWQLPMLVVLGENLRKGAWRAEYGFLILKLLIIETLLVLVTLVLWGYTGVLGYPIYALGAFAKSDFIQRFDAINMLVWAINCVIVSAVYIFASAKPIKKRLPGTALFAALSAAVALYEYKRGLRYNEPWFLWFKLVGAVVLGVAIPIAALIVRKVRLKREVVPA